ncbi:pentatricopeptide repeat-containing protein At3g51320-like [Silene latifolia]|uniref:pentatricopeptide repeat-containing protein At3g51320-like n=1 Tax=Silene latifolia TaxID=37657 RepID=UPI003D76C222
MARVLIRTISCRRYSSFSQYFPHYFIHDNNNNNNISIVHQISNYLDHKTLKRSQIYQIHAQLVTSGRIQNPFLCSKLLKLSSFVEDLRYILWVFDLIKNPNIVCVNTVIKACSLSCSPLKGVHFYFEVLKNGGIFPNSYTFPPLISCCSKLSDVNLGEMCHGQVIKYGFNGVLQIENSLIHMYASCGVIEIALKVFDGMLERDSVSWNSMIDAFAKMGDLKSAHKLFDVMPERNVVSWNVLMSGYLQGKNPGLVLKLFREMVTKEVLANDATVVNVVTACGRSARLKEGASVHGFLVRRLCNLNLIVNTALINMYNKCRKVDVARAIFDSLPRKNLVCWNSMILGHCLHGDPRDGLRLFGDMVRERVLPDEITFIGVICACTRAELMEEGRVYFQQMVDVYGLKPNFAHYWCMANLFASNGLLEEALETVRKVSDCGIEMRSESLVWATLLSSCRFQCETSVGEKVAKALIELEPNNAMCYVLLYNIYAAAGLWENAADVKNLMKKTLTGRLPGCNLVDLIDIVHNFRVADTMQCGEDIVMMINEVLRHSHSNSRPQQHSLSNIMSQP